MQNCCIRLSPEGLCAVDPVMLAGTRAKWSLGGRGIRRIGSQNQQAMICVFFVSSGARI